MNKALFNNHIANMEEYIMFKIKARQTELTPELKAKNRTPIALSMGAPVDRVPEFAIKKAIEYLDATSAHTYSTSRGEARFFEAVANRMKTRFNVELNPKGEIISLVGSKEGLANLMKALINPKENEKEQDVILVPTPGYASYLSMVKLAGGRNYEIELKAEDNFCPDMEKVLEKYIQEGNDPKKIKALLMNYPNNPLGCCCSLEYMQHCVDFCNKHGIILISDNAYCEMYFDENDKPRSALECKGAMDCCIEMYSFSKSYAMTGWRLGWACGNKDIVTMLSRAKSSIDTGVFKVLQYTGADLLESSEGQEYINTQNIKLKNKMQKFVDGLNSLGYSVKMPKATFYLWIKIPDRFSDCVDFSNQMLEKSGIVIVPGTAFRKDASRFVRLSVVADEESLMEVIRRMKEDGFEY